MSEAAHSLGKGNIYRVDKFIVPGTAPYALTLPLANRFCSDSSC